MFFYSQWLCALINVSLSLKVFGLKMCLIHLNLQNYTLSGCRQQLQYTADLTKYSKTTKIELDNF